MRVLGGGRAISCRSTEKHAKQAKQTNFSQFKNVSISNTTQKAGNGILRQFHFPLHFFKEFQMKKIALLFVALFCVSVFAQDLPKIAVYVSGNMRDDEKKALGTRMLSTIVKSGRYKAVERSDEFLNQLASEHIKQRSGAIDEAQIKRLGKQFGVDFICITDITPAFGMFYVSARIVNVETAEIVFMGEASDNLRTIDGLASALDKVWASMFGIQTVAAPEQKQENTATAASVSAQKLMKPKYEKTKMYPSEYLGAYGSYSIIGPDEVLTVLFAERNYYKVRTASGKEGFVMQKDVINSNAQFVDIRPGQSAVNTRQEAPVANTMDVTVKPRKETSTAPTEIQDDRPRRLENRISLELGYHFGNAEPKLVVSNLKTGEEYTNYSDGYFSLGAKVHLDLIYADLYGYNFIIDNAIVQTSHVLGKYPIDIGLIKVSPLLGYSTNTIMMNSMTYSITDVQFALGGRVDIGLSKSAFASTEFIYGAGGGSNSQSLKLGAGFDLGIGKKKKWYWRPELIYHFTRTAYSNGATIVAADGRTGKVTGDGEMAVSAHFVGLYVGLGYKWGGNKQSRSTAESIPAPSSIHAPEAGPTPPVQPPPPAQPRGSAPPASDWGTSDW
jgi:hypothetical protein